MGCSVKVPLRKGVTTLFLPFALLLWGIFFVFPRGGLSIPGRLYVPQIPDDLSQVDLYLITAGVGDEIANRFGHTGIRILDRKRGTDVVFNWGKFSFDSPGFAWKFFRGALRYSMGVRTFHDDVEVYRESGRRLVMDRLQLTTAQKLALISRIRWNAQPENREFSYQYWYKNCATIPRDYLNDILHQQIATYIGSRPAGRVYRDYVRKNLAYVPFLVPWLDVLMNGNIDHQITLWQDMFLPARLRDVLLEMPQVNDAGEIVLGSKLLGDETILVDVVEPMDQMLPDYLLLIGPVWTVLALALGSNIFSRRRSKSTGQIQFDDDKLGIKALALGAVYWGFLSGLTGLTLTLNWAFSGHPDGWANWNLMYLWPMDFLLIPIGIQIFKTGTRVKDRWPFAGAFTFYFVAKASGVAVLLSLHLEGIVIQDVTRVAPFFGGTSLVLCFAMWQMAFQRQALEGESKKPQIASTPSIAGKVQEIRQR